MGNLYFTIGLPRSGKSTLCTMWCEHCYNIADGKFIKRVNGYSPGERERVVVSADRVRLSFGHRYNADVEHLVFATVWTMTKALLYDYDVLLDETSVTTKKIKQTLAAYPYAQHAYVNTPPDVCKRRAIQTEQNDLIPVISKMHQNIWDLVWNGCQGGVAIADEMPNRDWLNGTVEKIRERVAK